MKKAKFVVLVDSDYLRDQQVCRTGVTDDPDAWIDIFTHGYLDIIEWAEDDVEGLLDFAAKDNEVSSNVLFAIKV